MLNLCLVAPKSVCLPLDIEQLAGTIDFGLRTLTDLILALCQIHLKSGLILNILGIHEERKPFRCPAVFHISLVVSGLEPS